MPLAVLAFPGLANAGTVFLLDGRGWGHGVGLSQWGAEGYARHGYALSAHPRALLPAHDVDVVRPAGECACCCAAEPVDARIGSASPFVVVDARGRSCTCRRVQSSSGRGFMRASHLLATALRAGRRNPCQVNLRPYRGDVVVKRRSDGLMAVNVLPLDRYLRGVVPWEAPAGWHDATYEAQAVAARSYTLATLQPGEDFDLYPDDVRRCTAASVPSARRRTSRSGRLPARCSSSAARSSRRTTSRARAARTSAIQDAWPGMTPEPYLVSVPDPYDYISPHHVWPTRC